MTFSLIVISRSARYLSSTSLLVMSNPLFVIACCCPVFLLVRRGVSRSCCLQQYVVDVIQRDTYGNCCHGPRKRMALVYRRECMRDFVKDDGRNVQWKSIGERCRV